MITNPKEDASKPSVQLDQNMDIGCWPLFPRAATLSQLMESSQFKETSEAFCLIPEDKLPLSIRLASSA